jgi:lipoprotein-anchoring transpeptidase ErfK/SrfK
VLFYAMFMAACGQPARDSTPTGRESSDQRPTIEASPVSNDNGRWKIVTGDWVNLSVKAPGALRAGILYRPVATSDQFIELKNFEAPTNAETGEFAARIRLPADFAGEVWAEASYPDGSKKETDSVPLASVAAVNREAAPTPGPLVGSEKPSTDGSGDPIDKSAFSDQITGGKVELATFQPGQPDVKISVNVPAFQLCFWQNGKLVKEYEIGVGRKDFPIDISNREIWQIVFNPEWVPPDSPWVNKNPRVIPGEHVSAGDSRNPLGKIKIPLGDGYLIHQAEKKSDIGHLVSHGCIRMEQADLIDLSQKLISAQSVPASQDRIQHALTTIDRMLVNLKRRVPISIRYDTLVVQQALLHVYPDIYDRGTNTVQNVRSDLAAVGIDTSRIPDQDLAQVVDRADKNEEYIVSTAAVRLGNGATAGHDEPLTSQNVAPVSTPRHTRQNIGRRLRHARKAPIRRKGML